MQLFLLLHGLRGRGGGGGGGAAAAAPLSLRPSRRNPPTNDVVIDRRQLYRHRKRHRAALVQWQEGGRRSRCDGCQPYTTPATTLTDDAATFQVVVTNRPQRNRSTSKLTVAAGTTQARGIDVTTYKTT